MPRRQNFHAPKITNQAKAVGRGFISLSTATKHCTYSQEYLSLLARRGELKAEKIGRNWYTQLEWLKNYIEDHPQELAGNVKGRLLEEERAVKVLEEIYAPADSLVKRAAVRK